MTAFIIYLLFLFIINSILIYFVINGNIKKLKKIFTKKSSDFKMHSYLVYQNAGIVVLGIFIISSLILWYFFRDNFQISVKISRDYVFFISIFCFYIMSIYDFLYKIHPINRLIIQLLLVYSSLSLISFPILPIEYFPIKVQYLFVIIFWVYIINITNFVDGLDGMIATTFISIFITSIIYLSLNNLDSINFYIATIFISLLGSFLLFNKPKAKIFLNDSGAIPIGYVFGFFLLNFASDGDWIIFFSIFFYFIADVSLSLILKIKNGSYPWARMFDYFFLKPVLLGKKKHSYVLKFIIFYYLGMSLLIIFNKYFINNNIIILSYSVVFSIFLLFHFNKFKKS
jgi:UDP-N-acetylmuramyl pentapeptide phosphotransferase/UDP-N-acetylglucosamine-1-phosphate transferase